MRRYIEKRDDHLTKHNFTSLMRRLSRAGFKNEFVRSAILPDWWQEAFAQDTDLLSDIEIRVARFLGLPLSIVRDSGTPLATPSYSRAQLRRVRDIELDRLSPAIHSAMQIAAAVARSVRGTMPDPLILPSDGLVWREQIDRDGLAVTLDGILKDLWGRGIPVVPLELLPTPSFQGIACIVEGRPVVLLGHKHDEPGRVAFFVAHETGHIAAGDCKPEQPVVDEEEGIIDESDMERMADRYAARVLVGNDSAPHLDGEGLDFKQLASRASELEHKSGTDASMIIFSWASHTRDYTRASMAVKALYRGSGARRRLRHYFDRHVDIDAATETDRALLRCVYGEGERDVAGG